MAQPQEYTVETWSPWEDRENDGAPVRDQHGNYRGSVTFVEDKSEPIDATFKTQPSPGDKKYGVVDLYQTRAGKTRKGFKSAPRPNPAFQAADTSLGNSGQQPAALKGTWQPDSPEKQDSIARSVALKAAVNWGNIHNGTFQQCIEDAEAFLVWLKGGTVPIPPQPATGYDKARLQAQQIRERLPEPPPQTFQFEGEEYPVDEVPYEYR